jgi:hypothetical protein
MHPAALPIDELLRDVTERRTKRSGPGGQHRNKVETAVVLTHGPTGVMAEGSERRSQKDNRRVAVQRLRVNLALEVRTTCAVDEPPSALWQSRARGGKISVSVEHEDFPALLAEAINRLHAADFDLPTAAQQLGVTTSQLVKLVRSEPRAGALLNRERAARNLSPLK